MFKVMSKSIRVVMPLAVLALAGCGGVEPDPKTSSSSAAPGDQIARGAELYAAKCAGCHGANGEGGGAPPLVGRSALPLDPRAGAKFRKTQFHTGADVFAFVKSAMPPKAPGTLSDDDYAAILAFDLKANGVDMTGKHVDTTTASSFVLHP